MHRLNKREKSGLFTDYTDWTKKRILSYPQISQIEQEREFWVIHRFERLNKRENYPQIAQIEKERKYLFFHRLHRLNKRKNTNYPQFPQIGQERD